MKPLMKQFRHGLLKAVAGIACASACFSIASPAYADGVETLGPPSIAIAGGTDFVTASFALRSNGADTAILNVPTQATIKQVLLYWEGFAGRDNQITLNGTLITGSEIGSSIPGTFINERSYRADITPLNLVGNGVNDIEVASLLRLPADLNGASIVVIYDEPRGVSYGGRAFGVQSGIGSNTTRSGDTGVLPPAGGDLSPSPVSNVAVYGLAGARVLSGRVLGAAGKTESTISVANVNALFSTVGLSADAIDARAAASCSANGPVLEGSSQFARLRLLGIDRPVSFPKNTVLLNLPGVLKVVVNEQVSSRSGGNGQILVNAVHVTSPLLAFVLPIDVVIASAKAEINCAASSQAKIEIRDGLDGAFAILETPPFPIEANQTVPQNFTFPANSFDRVASVHLLVASASASDPVGDTTRINIFVDNNLVFSEIDLLDEKVGSSWDDLRLPIPVPAGATQIRVQLLSETENFIWVFAGLVLDTAPPPSNDFSGRATVANVAYKYFASATVADTGALPLTGGSLDASLNNLSLTQGVLLTGTTAEARTTGAGEQSRSTAAIQSLNLSALGVNAVASVVKSTTQASCDVNNNATVSGNAEIVNLTVFGVPIVVAPNLEVPLPLGGVLHVNEQIVTRTAPNIASITVNALRYSTPALHPSNVGIDLVSVTLASSHSDIVCR